MINYDAINWYWAVAGSTTQVFSSARLAYVPVADATYVAWLAAGNAPTSIDSPGSLWQVLVAQLLPRATPAVALTSTGTSALNGVYSTSPDAIAQIVALATGILSGKPLPGGGSSFNYPDAAGTMHAFIGSDFINFAVAVENMVYAAEQALSTLLNGGSASLPSSALTIA